MYSSIFLLYPQHDDVIKWKHFSRYWPFVPPGNSPVTGEFHSWPVNSPQKGQRREALMFSLICAWTNTWVNNRDAGDLRCHRTAYDVTVLNLQLFTSFVNIHILHVRYLLMLHGCSSLLWRQNMEILSTMLALCEGNRSPVHFPHTASNSEFWFCCC